MTHRRIESLDWLNDILQQSGDSKPTGDVVSKKEKKVLTKEDKLYKQITSVLALLVLAIYLIISILTMAWSITWILWIVYALLVEIIKLVFSLKGVEIHDEDE